MATQAAEAPPTYKAKMRWAKSLIDETIDTLNKLDTEQYRGGHRHWGGIHPMLALPLPRDTSGT